MKSQHILTIVLKNGDQNAPSASIELIYLDSVALKTENDDLNVSFKPSPNYAALANTVADGSGRLHTARPTNVGEFREAIEGAV